jgi:hypothetical protein
MGLSDIAILRCRRSELGIEGRIQEGIEGGKEREIRGMIEEM